MAEFEVKNKYDIHHPDIGEVFVGKSGFYRLENKTTNVNRKCTLCNGNKVVVLNGEEYICPKCKGNTTGEHWYSYKHYSLNEYYISKITLERGYVTDIGTESSKVGNCSIGLHFENCDYDKRGRVFLYTNIRFSDLRNHLIFTEEEAVKQMATNGSFYDYYFLDEALCKKVQRLLNKKEKESVAHYVEEAKRLKQETTEFEYKV